MSMTIDVEHVKALKATAAKVGFLQPCVREKGTNRILVGRHRKLADPNWPEIEVEVSDDLHRELIILFGNKQRQPSEAETAMRFLRIARILEAKGIEKKRICTVMASLLDGVFTQRYIEQLLPKEYKMECAPKRRTSSTSEVAKNVKEVLKHTNLQPKGNVFAFADCKCQECIHLNECY